MVSPTETTLIEMLKRKKLDNLLQEIEDGTTTYEDCLARTKIQFKELYGPAAGIDLYNHLHPPKNNTGLNELLDFAIELEEDSLCAFVTELGEEPSPISVYKALTKRQWKELCGPMAVDIFNYLHPRGCW